MSDTTIALMAVALAGFAGLCAIAGLIYLMLKKKDQ